ncbi:hypothetical protein LJC25_03080 [Bacteroidales bacterium OttesenSCG-928-K03]|nr:hypothetical protein [Odoribacter sp. OttesenSCG-928-L07]MDL2242693.1 hypothetical protein [Bacteroidales bacterium OttesenSCG-928-K03]
MKKLLFLAALISFFAVSCEKPEPPEPPEEPETPKELTKYLSSISILADDSTQHVMETYTWDENDRLIAIKSSMRTCFRDVTFTYDLAGRISEINDYTRTLSVINNRYEFYYNDDNLIDSVLFYVERTETTFLSLVFYYKYDADGRNTEIVKKRASTDYEMINYIEWNGNNINKLFTRYNSHDNYFINCNSHDNMNNPWSECPKIILLHTYGILYNISENNPLKFEDIVYEYEYNELDYPIKQYRIENGVKTLKYIFEYKYK